jgi:pyridoxine 4-dehydrogenase
MPEIMGKEIGPIGYGLMGKSKSQFIPKSVTDRVQGLTWRPQPAPEEQAFKAMKASLDNGCNFWNAGEFYGTPDNNSLTLMESYFTKYPEDASKVVLSIKGGLNNMIPDGSPEGVRKSVDNCLKLLKGKKAIDIFEMARVDKKVSLETTLKTLEEYVSAGKIGGIALSEVNAATIKKAVSITRIVAVEVELSLFTTHILGNGVSTICAEHNIPIVAYSPLSRGFLTGEIKSFNDIPEGDFRRGFPRFQPENFDTNLEIVKEVQKLSKEKGCTTAQIAINWVRCQSKKVSLRS